VLYVQLYMPLELPSFIDHGRWAVARDFLMKTTYWPPSTHDSSIFPEDSKTSHHTTSHAFQVKRRQNIETTFHLIEDEQFEWSEHQ